MVKILVFSLILIPMVVSAAMAQYPVLESDTLWIDSVAVKAGEQAEINIWYKNAGPVKATDVALLLHDNDLLIDSVSFDGSRFDTLGLNITEIDTAQAIVRFGNINLLSSAVSPGTGLLAKIFVTIPVDHTAEVIPIDTITVFPDNEGALFFVDSTNAGFQPIYIKGYLDIDLATGVETDTDLPMPTEFDLKQNYPNPFNPTTRIAFAVPRQGHVRLDVFNLLGQKVRTLVDEDLPAGNHSVEFDGTDNYGSPVASGIYFYRITTADDTDSKKMLLLK